MKNLKPVNEATIKELAEVKNGVRNIQ